MKGYFKKRWMGFRLRLIPEADNLDFLAKCCRNDIEKDPGFKTVASSSFTRVYQFEFEGVSYFYKQYFSRSIFEPVKNLLRDDRAFRSLRGDLLLLRNGFNAPKCMMIGKKGRNIFMVSEAIQGGKNLVQFVEEEFPENMKKDKIFEKRKLCRLLGKQIGKLHAKGIFHGDLRWGNVMIQKSTGSEPGIWFLDNERTIACATNSKKMRLVNLVQMNMVPVSTITSMDRMRFYNAYLAQNPGLMNQRKRLALRVVQKTAARFAVKEAKNKKTFMTPKNK